MSAKNVKAFYKQFANNPTIRQQLESSSELDEWIKIASDYGYRFTEQELEDVTANLLELNEDSEDLKDLDTRELAEVFGGIIKVYPKRFYPIYGVVVPPRPRSGTIWV